MYGLGALAARFVCVGVGCAWIERLCVKNVPMSQIGNFDVWGPFMFEAFIFI